MKIALFSDTYTPDLNGVSVSTRILRDELIKKGHQVVVITTELPSESKYQDLPEDNILRVPGLEIQALYGYRASNVYSFKGMRELKEMNVDVIHIQTEFGIGIFGRIAGETLDVPTVYTYHTMWADYTHYVNPIKLASVNKVIKKAIEGISRLYSDMCTELIVPSQKTLDALKGYGLKRNDVHIIPTGLQLEKFDPQNANHDAITKIEQEYNLVDKFVVTFLGRVAEEKSIDFVLDAIEGVADKCPNLVFLVVGGGPQLDDLKNYAKKLNLDNKVIFVGPKPPEEVPSFYHASDLFISASLSETQGLTYIEAMASAVPVLARYDDELISIIDDKVSGYFFRTKEELIDLLVMLGDKDLTTLKQKAYEKAQSFSSSKFGDDVIKVYEEAIRHKHYTYTVRSITQVKNRLNEVVFQQDGNSIILDLQDSIISTYEIEIGKEYERDVFDSMKNLELIHEAYNKALGNLAVRDYSRGQMIESLTKDGKYSKEQIADTILLLESKGLIDDQDLTMTYLKSAPGKGIGINKAIFNLRTKYLIDIEVIDTCLMELNDDTEYQGATELIDRFYPKYISLSYNKALTKIKTLLFNKGFRKDIIEKAMDDYDFEYDEEMEIQVLAADLRKAYHRFKNRYEGKELDNKLIDNMLKKGYSYDNIKYVMSQREEIFEND